MTNELSCIPCDTAPAGGRGDLKAGDWVDVKSPEEIARTLAADGTLDGLAFMPEMLPFCGRRFQVLRTAEKLCVEATPGGYRIREFRNNDVVILRELRCSGADHEGCGRACVLFWKTVWLRKAAGPEPPAARGTRYGSLMEKLRTQTAPDRYFCQSTEMMRATEPLSRGRILKKCLREIRVGNRGIFEMARLTLMPLWRKATEWMPRPRLTGELKRTPTAELQLQPGELVEIRSAAEIAETLDPRGRNRGLICDYGMCQYSGGTYRVRNRLDRMISEPTGQMRRVENTVILEGLQCLCWNVFGGCPRGDFMYWREIWLKRAARNGGMPEMPTAETAGLCPESTAPGSRRD
jgi:hypothetical protein